MTYDPERSSSLALARVIATLGFRAELVAHVAVTVSAEAGLPLLIEVPASAPAFLRLALDDARRRGVPVAIDFHASWCGPCRRLEAETLQDERVRRSLATMTLLRVDLDEHPKLAEVYGIVSVPHVVFLDREGLVVERLTTFEGPRPFRKRLKRLQAAPRKPRQEGRK